MENFAAPVCTATGGLSFPRQAPTRAAATEPVPQARVSSSTALVGADGQVLRPGEAHKIDVGARRLKPLVETEQPAPFGHQGGLQVVHRHHQVRHPHPDEMAGDVNFFQGDALPIGSSPHPGHGQLHPAALDLGLDNARQGLEREILRAMPCITAKRAAQRPPLPHISGSEPSAL